MSSELVSITPLGGVGQIGSNMTLVSSEGHNIIVDAGILFPYEDFFGINYLIPNVAHLKKVDDLVITHGHEDHIGAIIHFLESFPEVNVHAPLFAAKLIERKLNFNKTRKKINIYQANTTLKLGDVKVDPVQVNHSIPDTFGLHFSFQNKVSLFLVSDFKIDHKTPYEQPFDFKRLNKVSKGFAKKVLMADSTNMMSKTLATLSEIDLKDPLQNIIKESKQHTFITTFSSNIHRIQTILNIAKEEKRPVVAIGRSMKAYIETALATEHLKESTKVHFDLTHLKSKNIIFIISGCQADFKSALRRIINGDDKTIKPKKGDTLVFSSKSIPGHEKRIGLVINKAIEQGLSVYSDQNALVHVSGHPGKEDLEELYRNYHPNVAMPIHGESRFLEEHRKFLANKFPEVECHRLLNHSTLKITKELEFKTKLNEKIDPIIIHGNRLELDKASISERRKMATQGLVTLSLNSKYQFELQSLGIPDIDNKLLEEAQEHCQKVVSLFNAKDIAKGDSSVKEELRLNIRNFFTQVLGYKPLVIVHLLP